MMIGSVELVWITEAAKSIGYTSENGFLKWCKKHCVTVYDHIKGKAVNAFEFEMAVHKPLIEKLKSQHGENWMDIYKSFIEKDITKMVSLTEKKPIPIPEKIKRYIPKSEQAKNLLKDL